MLLGDGQVLDVSTKRLVFATLQSRQQNTPILMIRASRSRVVVFARNAVTHSHKETSITPLKGVSASVYFKMENFTARCWCCRSGSATGR
jgi:hypothetical protein